MRKRILQKRKPGGSTRLFQKKSEQNYELHSESGISDRRFETGFERYRYEKSESFKNPAKKKRKATGKKSRARKFTLDEDSDEGGQFTHGGVPLHQEQIEDYDQAGDSSGDEQDAEGRLTAAQTRLLQFGGTTGRRKQAHGVRSRREMLLDMIKTAKVKKYDRLKTQANITKKFRELSNKFSDIENLLEYRKDDPETKRNEPKVKKEDTDVIEMDAKVQVEIEEQEPKVEKTKFQKLIDEYMKISQSSTFNREVFDQMGVLVDKLQKEIQKRPNDSFFECCERLKTISTEILETDVFPTVDVLFFLRFLTKTFNVYNKIAKENVEKTNFLTSSIFHFICGILGSSIIESKHDILSGLFLVSILLNLTTSTNYFIPEIGSFLVSAINSLPPQESHVHTKKLALGMFWQENLDEGVLSAALFRSLEQLWKKWQDLPASKDLFLTFVGKIQHIPASFSPFVSKLNKYQYDRQPLHIFIPTQEVEQHSPKFLTLEFGLESKNPEEVRRGIQRLKRKAKKEKREAMKEIRRGQHIARGYREGQEQRQQEFMKNRGKRVYEIIRNPK